MYDLILSLKIFILQMTTASVFLLGIMALWQSAMWLSEEVSPGLCRHLNCNGIHDQGHKFSNNIVDIQFVELKANISDVHALTLCYSKIIWHREETIEVITLVSMCV